MKTISVSVANYCLEIAKTTKIIQLQIVWRLSVKVMTPFGLTDKLSSSGRHHVWFLWVWGSNSENSSTVSKLETVTSDEG